jgi:hypothetical protein
MPLLNQPLTSIRDPASRDWYVQHVLAHLVLPFCISYTTSVREATPDRRSLQTACMHVSGQVAEEAAFRHRWAGELCLPLSCATNNFILSIVSRGASPPYAAGKQGRRSVTSILMRTSSSFMLTTSINQ